MPQNYAQLTASITDRTNPEHLQIRQSVKEDLATLKYGDVLYYIRVAMKGVEPEYTQRNKEAGENAKQHLSFLANVTFAYQGSVMTNTHIKASSDIDLLVLTSKFYSRSLSAINNVVNTQYLRNAYQDSQVLKLEEEARNASYVGNWLDDLRQLRLDSEVKLRSVYTSCDITHAKAIKIRNRGLGRDVDVVIANYFDDVKSIVNNKGSFRGVEVYNKAEHNVGLPDYPFLSIERINARGAATQGRIKKMIRFLKNLKYKSTYDIQLTSFDFNAICYDISPSDYNNLIFYQLVPVLYRQIKSLCNDSTRANSLMSVDGREYIFRDQPNKLQHLRNILLEIEGIYNDLISSRSAVV